MNCRNEVKRILQLSGGLQGALQPADAPIHAVAGGVAELIKYPHYLYVLCCCGKTMQNTFKEFQFQSLRALLFHFFRSILVKIHNLFARFSLLALLALRAWFAFNSERMTVQKAL